MSALSSLSIESLEERKASLRQQMVRWEVRYEAEHNTKPTAANKRASAEWLQLRIQLKHVSQRLLVLSMSAGGAADECGKSSPGRASVLLSENSASDADGAGLDTYAAPSYSAQGGRRGMPAELKRGPSLAEQRV